MRWWYDPPLFFEKAAVVTWWRLGIRRYTVVGRVGSVETVRIEERETEDMRVIMLWWMGV